jgi:phosphoglycolate phosphatase
MNQAFEANGLAPLAREKVLSIVGLSLPLAIEMLIPNESSSCIAAVTEGYRGAFGVLRRDPSHNEPLYPGVLELISELSAQDDVLLGVATGKSIRGVDALFERMNLGGHFHTIQTADTHPSKPHPSMVLRAMEEAGAEPQDTIMIGDTTYDIEMAQRAGVAPIGVTWGYHPVASLRDAGAIDIAHDTGDLGRMIAAKYA